MKIIKVAVSQEDITNGGSDCNTCPIALALTRAFLPEIVAVDVGAEEVDIAFECRTLMRASLPLCAQAFVARFDGRHAVSPISFEITFF